MLHFMLRKSAHRKNPSVPGQSTPTEKVLHIDPVASEMYGSVMNTEPVPFAI